MTDLIDKYFNILQEVYDYFGYREGWRTFAVVDYREYVWDLIDGDDRVGYSHGPITEESIEYGMDIFDSEVFTYTNQTKWTYEKEDYTMILLDTQTDGNIDLAIFDNKKRQRLTEELKELWHDLW